MPNKFSSVRQQLDRELTRLEEVHRSKGNRPFYEASQLATTIHVSGLTFDDQEVQVVLQVGNRHKQVFGKYMLCYRLALDGPASPFTDDIRQGGGRAALAFPVIGSIERRASFIKWASAAIQEAGERLHVEYRRHPEARPDHPAHIPAPKAHANSLSGGLLWSATSILAKQTIRDQFARNHGRPAHDDREVAEWWDSMAAPKGA